MTVLLTGAAGFIGMHVAEILLRRGERVIGVDSLNDYYDPRLKRARVAELARHNGFSFAALDVADLDALAAHVDAQGPVDRIVHLAAQAGARYSIEAPFAFVQANVVGHLAVLELCRRLDGRIGHLVYASSSSVYGSRATVPFSEDDPATSPVSLYAATKRADELMTRAYGHLFAVPATGLRFFTAYGPWGRPDMAYFSFARAIRDGRTIRLFNGGDMRRDFTWIGDVAAGVVAALDRPPPPDEEGVRHAVYNLGNERAEPIGRLVEILERAIGRPAIVEMAPMHPGDVKETFADVRAARRDLGWAPTTTLDEGLPRFVDWLRTWEPW